MSFRVLLPSAFTVGNMVCGFLAITTAVRGDLSASAWLILLGAILDGLDGTLARTLQVDSRFGREFDSLADFVSFGVAPMVLVYDFLLVETGFWTWIICGLFLIAGAFRLVRHNITQSVMPSGSYTGLPITAAGITMAGFMLFELHNFGQFQNLWALLGIIACLSIFMVSSIRFVRFPLIPGKHPKWLKFLLLILVSLAILIRPQVMVFTVSVVYILAIISVEFVKLISGKVSRSQT